MITIKVSRDFRHGLLVVAASYIAFAGGYVVHVISSRWLGPVEYATVGAAGSILSIPLLFLGAVEMASAQSLIRLGQNQRTSSVAPDIQAQRLFVLTSGAVATLALLLGALPITHALRLRSADSVFVVGFMIPFYCLATWRRAVYRSRNDFDRFAVRTVAEKGASILAAIVALWTGFGAIGVVAANGLGCIVWLLGSSPNTTTSFECKPGVSVKNLVRLWFNQVAHSLIAIYLALGVVANLDVLIVQGRSSPETTGRYAVVALFGRALFLGMLVLIGVLIPKVACLDDGDKRGAIRLLGQYAAIGAAVSVAAIFVAQVFGARLLDLVFGVAYVGAAPVLGPQMAFASLVGFQGLISCYGQVRRIPGSVALHVLSAFATACLLVAFSTDVQMMLEATIIGQTVCIVGCVIWTSRNEKSMANRGSTTSQVVVLDPSNPVSV